MQPQESSVGSTIAIIIILAIIILGGLWFWNERQNQTPNQSAPTVLPNSSTTNPYPGSSSTPDQTPINAS